MARNAEVVLKTMDLKVGDTLFRPDFARNAVLEQRMNGQLITAGTKIKKGSSITLVLGDGVKKGSTVGDLMITLEVKVPQRVDGAAKKAVEAFADATRDFNPREELLKKANS